MGRIASLSFEEWLKKIVGFSIIFTSLHHSNRTLNKRNFIFRQLILLVQFFIRPNFLEILNRFLSPDLIFTFQQRLLLQTI